jgi:hypothetical protein
MDNLVSQTKRLGWNGGIVQLDIDSGIEESTKLLLLGKILSNKSFPRTVVKDIVGKAWNLINEVEVKGLLIGMSLSLHLIMKLI